MKTILPALFATLRLPALEMIAANGAFLFLESGSIFSTLEILFLLFRKEFREGTYTPLRGVSMVNIV